MQKDLTASQVSKADIFSLLAPVFHLKFWAAQFLSLSESRLVNTDSWGDRMELVNSQDISPSLEAKKTKSWVVKMPEHEWKGIEDDPLSKGGHVLSAYLCDYS